jgi:iron complex outermembrane recepter protein
MRTATLAAAVVMAIVEWPSQVLAQNEPAAAATEETGALEEVTVTAQRREESLQRAAVPVTELSGGALAGSTRLEDLTQFVPSVQIASAAGPYPLMYVRGVGNVNGNALSDAALAVNLDGVYLARPSSTAGMMLFYARCRDTDCCHSSRLGRGARQLR